jgi:uncharacterized protein (TIGR03067 family)
MNGLLIALVVAGIGQATATDEDKLQGTWIVESLEMNGEKMPEKELKEATKEGLSLIFQGDKMIFQEPGRRSSVPQREVFTLDPKASPRTIDAYSKPNPKLVKKGIYEVDGDRLKLAFNKESPEKRPMSFASAAGSNVLNLVFKRDKTKPAEAVKADEWKDFPKLLVGKWEWKGGETVFPLKWDTEFTKDGKVLEFNTDKKVWEERYTYKLDKDELLLTPIKGVKGKVEQRIGIYTLTADKLLAEYPTGELARMK